MQTNKSFIIASVVACTASALVAPSARAAYTTVTQTYQQGVGGYTGEISRSFASSTSNGTTRGDNKGAAPTANGVSVDGYNGTDSPDQPIFMKFDNLFGAGAIQIPANAFIIDATLTLTTASSGSANSGGAFVVSSSLVPWNTTTSTYNNLKPAGSAENGLSWANGIITRPVAAFDDPTILYGGAGSLNYDQHYTANVTPLVRAWTNGSVTNNGFVINNGFTSGGTADAWQVKAENHATVADRPKLTVTYTTAPVQTATFQEGVNGYAGTTMSWLRLINNTGNDGSNIDNAFLDGWQDNPDFEGVSSDDHALVKFNNLFQDQGGSIPKTARIVKATLVLTTSAVSNAQTGQVFEAHQMLRNWDTSTRWTDFNEDDGIRTGIDEGSILSANYDMTPNSEAYFDITSAVDGWRTGQGNYGIDIRATRPTPDWSSPNGTSDGWSIFFTGATDPTLRPQLSISYILRMDGDANENGKIDADDFALIDRGFAKHLTGWASGDFNVDGVVDAADYLIIDSAWATQGGHPLDPSFLASREAEFGAAYVSSLLAAVPEPTSLSLLALGAAATLTRRRRSQ